MTKKMIEQFVIMTMDNEVVETAEDIPNEGNYKGEPSAVRIYDRARSKSVAKVDTKDKTFTFFLAQAIVSACDEYIPVEPEEEDLVDGSN